MKENAQKSNKETRAYNRALIRNKTRQEEEMELQKTYPYSLYYIYIRSQESCLLLQLSIIFRTCDKDSSLVRNNIIVGVKKISLVLLSFKYG